MFLIKQIVIITLTIIINGCGGGGGSAGTPMGTAASTDPVSAADVKVQAISSLSLSVLDKDKKEVTSHTLLRGADYFLSAALLDSKGQAIPYALVTFSVDSVVATLPVTAALTNSVGVAQVLIKSAGLNAAAGSATATSKGDTLSVSGTVTIQTQDAVVVLGDLSAPSLNGALPANQSVNLQTTVTVDKNSAPKDAFKVSFVASCGLLSSESAATDASGQVRLTYTAKAECTSPVKIRAELTTTGLTQTKELSIYLASATPSAIVFVAATVPTMVSKRVGGASSQSTLTFKLIDASGNAIQTATELALSLDDASKKAGVVFDDGTSSTRKTTGTDGTISVIVKAGNIPSPVTVTVTEPTSGVNAPSWGVAISSGMAVQDQVSLSADKSSLEALKIDNVTATLTFSASDRFGNPVPAKTQVNFVTKGGVITGSSNGTCQLNESSQCSVTFRSLNGTGSPQNGRVTVLAYMSGEESFTDKNGDGVWQPGESFVALGKAYFDANWNGSYEAATEQVLGSGDPQGTGSCPTESYPSVPNTCDTSKWRDDVLVRSHHFLVMATQNAAITQVGARKSSGFWVWISDANTDPTLKWDGTQSVSNTIFKDVVSTDASPTINTLLTDAGYDLGKTFLYNNAMPSGSTITASVDTGSAKCTAQGTNIDKFPSSQINGMLVLIRLGEEADCTTVGVSVTVKSPGGISTTGTFK